MDKYVDQDTVREFYNNTSEIWASDDHWHLWSKQQIEKYLHSLMFQHSDYVLNAGSGGNTYGITCNMVHVDIADQKLVGVSNAIVSSIEKMPINDAIFDAAICVGSVINYCDAAASIAELSRVLKQNGTLILEFENSLGYEYKGTSAYCKAATVITVKFQGQDHTQWLYSFKYIKSLLLANGLIIDDVFPYQIMSSLALKHFSNETVAVKYAKLDCFARKIPFISAHANNIIIRCHKL